MSSPSPPTAIRSEDTNAAAYEDPPANSSPNSENAGNKSGTITYTSVAPVEGSYDVVNNDGSASPASGMYSTVMKSGRGTPVRQQQPIAQIGPGSSTSMYGQTMPMGGPKPIGIEHSYATAPVVAEAEAARKSSRYHDFDINLTRLTPPLASTNAVTTPPRQCRVVWSTSGWSMLRADRATFGGVVSELGLQADPCDREQADLRRHRAGRRPAAVRRNDRPGVRLALQRCHPGGGRGRPEGASARPPPLMDSIRDSGS